MGRPNTQKQRRRELAAAALEAAAEHGLRELSLTAVANKAGLTRGALLYYYADLDALLIEAHEVGTQRIGDEREARVAQESTARAKLEAAIDAGLPNGADDALMRLLYEFDILAGAPLHDVLVEAMYERQLLVYRTILGKGRDSGEFNPQGDIADIAMNLVALEDAYGLHIVAGNKQIGIDDARRAMHQFARQAGCPVTER